MSSGLPLPMLAKDILARNKKGDEYYKSAGLHLLEAKERVEAGEAGDILWTAWHREHIPDIKPRHLQKLMQIGRGDTTKSELNDKSNEAARKRAHAKSPVRKTLDSALKKLANALNDDQLEEVIRTAMEKYHVD